MKRSRLIFHFTALAIMAIWGCTFVSTKVLLMHGLTPAWIFLIRFSIAYIGMWLLCLKYPEKRVNGHTLIRRRLLSGSTLHELIFLLLGISGGSLYFLTENNALAHTQACNVSFIVCSAPLFVTIFTMLSKKLFKGNFADGLEDVSLSWTLVIGTLLAFGGMAMVLFEGNLNLSLKGDLLSLAAALCWAVYSLFMCQMTERYGTLMATRKVFFYGLVTIIPIIIISHNPAPEPSALIETEVWGNLLFLGFMASLVCFVGWNWAMAGLGNVTSTNYVYLNPLFTLVGAVIILGESMTATSAIGSAFILLGVILAGIRKRK